MTDTAPTSTSVTIADPHNVQTVFINDVASGFLNGVVNITGTTYRWTPTDDGKVDPDAIVAARLRMDLGCTRALHASLGSILDAVAKSVLEANTTMPKDTKAN